MINGATTAAEYRQLAATLRAQAAAGGGMVSYQFGQKRVQRESIKDLLAAAAECDRLADDLDGVGSEALGASVLVWRR